MSFASAGTASPLQARGPSPVSVPGTSLWGRTHAKGYLTDKEGAPTRKVFLCPPSIAGTFEVPFSAGAC